MSKFRNGIALMSNAKPTGRTETIHDRVANLEKKLDVLSHIQGEALKEQTARCIQSIGLVIDYLAANGLIDRDALTLHIERNFQVTDHYSSGNLPVAAVDVYGWLRWSAIVRELQNRGCPPWAELAIDPSSRTWSRDRFADPDIEIRTPRNMQVEAEAGQ